MKIAPIDIAHKTFNRKVMGLDPDEVMDFMRDIADHMEEIIRERNSLKEALRQKEMSLMDYKERDETLKSTIQTAAKMSDGIRADAEREAKLIIGDAQQKSDMILKDSRDQLKRVYQEIADLKRLRMQFEVNLRTICQSHIQMIDQSHMAVPDPQINLAQAQAHANVQPNQAAGAQAAPVQTPQQAFAARVAAHSAANQATSAAVFQPTAPSLASQGFAPTK
jgi:cell division initiation protein